MTKRLTAGWIGPQPGDPKPILYFSGHCGNPSADQWKKGSISAYEKRMALEGPINYRCFSYAFVGPKEFMPHSFDRQRDTLAWYHRHKRRMFLDSGAFSIQQAIRKGSMKNVNMRPIINSYARFILKEAEQGHSYDFQVTFDYLKQAPLVYEVTRFLRKEYGLQLTPVYHGDSSLDWFHRYVDEGHRLICVGRVKALGSRGLRAYYERLFEEADRLGGVQLHGLMVTGQNVYRFPWHSVDSATWTRLAAHGRIALVDPVRRRISHIRVSNTNISKGHQELIRRNGFDPDTLASSALERRIYNIREFLKVCSDFDYLTGRAKWAPFF